MKITFIATPVSTIVGPSVSFISVATSRAMASFAAPGATGTTSVIGLVGNGWASATEAATAPAARTQARLNREINFIRTFFKEQVFN